MGEVVYLSLDSLPAYVQPNDFAHFTSDENEAIDLAGVGHPSLNTVRKHVSSKVGVDTEVVYEFRRGCKNHKLLKTSGFKFKRRLFYFSRFFAILKTDIPKTVTTLSSVNPSRL